MKTVFLTTSDPIYLPAFFDRVLAGHASQTQAVYVVPPLYKGQTPVRALLRYWRTFGARGTMGLAARVLRAKVKRSSIQSTCARHGVVYSKVSDVNAADFVEHLREPGRTDRVRQLSADLQATAPGASSIRVVSTFTARCCPSTVACMPSFWMLANGERLAGVSIYFMDEQIDAGELCGQRIFEIEPEETLDAFLRRSKVSAAELLVEVLAKLEAGELERAPLDLTPGLVLFLAGPPGRAPVPRFRETSLVRPTSG